MKRVKKPVKIPFRQALFWDVDPKTIDPKKHAQYVIERILDFGNDNEVRWIWQTYPAKTISETMQRSRILHKKSKNLWSMLIKTV
ncbi:MAG: hypothetical protein V1664_04875 [Candidatus Uhrbacteria bacterium]